MGVAMKRNESTIRVVWFSQEAGEVVKHYKGRSLNDIGLMRGFRMLSYMVIKHTSKYAAECSNQFQRKVGV